MPNSPTSKASTSLISGHLSIGKQSASSPATCVPSRSASSTTAVSGTDTRLPPQAPAGSTMTTQTHRYPAKTYLRGMASWQPPHNTTTSRSSFNCVNDFSQIQRASHSSVERQPRDLARQDTTPVEHNLSHQEMTPMERFRAEGVSEQAFSFARVGTTDTRSHGEEKDRKNRHVTGGRGGRPLVSPKP